LHEETEGSEVGPAVSLPSLVLNLLSSSSLIQVSQDPVSDDGSKHRSRARRFYNVSAPRAIEGTLERRVSRVCVSLDTAIFPANALNTRHKVILCNIDVDVRTCCGVDSLSILWIVSHGIVCQT